MPGYLPKRVEFLTNEVFFPGKALALTLKSGLCVFVGPNGSGKTEVLKWLRGKVRTEPPLDALTDDNQLVNVFSDIAQPFAHRLGMGSVGDIDRSIRDKLNALLDDAFEALSPRTETHRYWTSREEDPDNEQKAKRRATVAALLSGSDSELREILGGALVELRTRFDALIKLLAQAGCVVLRKGTIEDYYFANYPGMGKPEAAASEAEGMGQQEENALRDQYKDVFVAIETAAPLRKIDENALLREQLGSLLGAAMQIVQPGMSDDELNARAAANLGTEGLVFSFANRSTNENSGTERRLEVHITSSLFKRDSFPFEVGERDNIIAIVQQKLPITR